jgi:prophage DNA circulation protein
MADWQKKLIKPAFRGIPFYSKRTTNEFGRRIALHEYPQYDTPYAEDMGRKARKFQISGFVIGEDWETQRDKLIKACEEPSSGSLSHPDYGNFQVVCENVSVTESKVEGAMMAEFEFTFIETGANKFPNVQQNNASALQKLAGGSILSIANVFKAINFLTKLPQYATDYVMGIVGDLTGIYNPNQLLNTYTSIQNLMKGDITVPWQFPVLASMFTGSFNRDYCPHGTKLQAVRNTAKDKRTGERFVIPTSITTEQAQLKQTDVVLETVETTVDEQTETLNPRMAFRLLSAIGDVKINHIAPITDSDVIQYESGLQAELLIKSFAVIEAAVAASQIDYESLDDAQKIWTKTLGQFDTLLKMATDIGSDTWFVELRKVRAAFQADIQERAPNLSVLTFKSYPDPTPSLVIAYDVYEDITRASEIVLRNHVKHPGFVVNDNLELLSE